MTVELVLGTAQLRTAYGVVRRTDEAPDAAHALALLASAAELGVDALDTAPAYGEAEAAIGEANGTWRVHTKIDPRLTPAESLAGSLARLRRNHVDVLYLHDSAEVLVAGSAVVASAHRLVGSQVGVLGASVYDLDELDAAIADPRIGAVQVPMNLFDRRLEDRVTAAAERGVLVYARSALLQGVLAAPASALAGSVERLGPYVEQFHSVAHRLGRPAVELALGWVRSRPGVRGVAVGAESVDDLRGIVAAFRSAPLSAAELAELTALEVPPAELCDPRRWVRAAS